MGNARILGAYMDPQPTPKSAVSIMSTMSTGFRQKLTDGNETHMEEEDVLAVGYEVLSVF